MFISKLCWAPAKNTALTDLRGGFPLGRTDAVPATGTTAANFFVVPASTAPLEESITRKLAAQQKELDAVLGRLRAWAAREFGGGGEREAARQFAKRALDSRRHWSRAATKTHSSRN